MANGCVIDLEFLTYLGVTHPIEQHGNAHPLYFLKILDVDIVSDGPQEV